MVAAAMNTAASTSTRITIPAPTTSPPPASVAPTLANGARPRHGDRWHRAGRGEHLAQEGRGAGPRLGGELGVVAEPGKRVAVLVEGVRRVGRAPGADVYPRAPHQPKGAAA